MIINLANDITKSTGIQQTYVATGINTSGTTSPVRNSDGFTANWAVQVGQTGEETAEILIVSGIPSGTALNFGTNPTHTGGSLLFSHAQDSIIYQTHYDQIIFSRSVTGTAGPFSALATVSIQPDNQFTQYNDPAGVGTYAYYAQYYNSVNGDTSGSSSIFLPGGPTFYSLQKLRSRTKDKLFSAGYIRSDNLVTDWINEWMEMMTNSAIKVNQGYMIGTNMYGFGTAGLGTITDPFFKQVVKMEVTYDGVQFIPSTEIAIRSYTQSDYFSLNSPRHAWVGENVFEILPHSQAGSVKVTYSQRFTPLVNDSDEPPLTLKAYTTSCTEYCLSVAYGLDQKDTESQQHFQLYDQGKQDFIAEITPRDQTSAKSIDITESISGMNEGLIGDYADFVV